MNLPAGIRLWSKAIAAALVLGLPTAKAEEFESVSSKVSSDYVRVKLPDGSFKPETYTFGKGGYWISPLADKSIDDMDFMDVARTIAVPLANQGYVPSKDPKEIKLLIMVYWGTTHAPEKASDSMAYQDASRTHDDLDMALFRMKAAKEEGNGGNQSKYVTTDQETVDILESQMVMNLTTIKNENDKRYLEDERIAMLLGYESWWNTTMSAPDASVLGKRRLDMLDELEHYRYFVVLMAYDFQTMWKQKKHKLLWETRFSIREQNNQFDRQLASMALEASSYFGRNSDGLVHRPLPGGRVGIKEPTLIELLESKK